MKLIPLSRGLFAKVDNDDYGILSRQKWYAQWSESSNSWYARRSHPAEKMHALILGKRYGKIIDHINHDTLDNRKENLRFVNYSQNQWNQKRRNDNNSGYVGVVRYSIGNKWCAQITNNKKYYFIGIFDSKEEAALARDKKAIELRGKFAILNFPNQLSQLKIKSKK